MKEIDKQKEPYILSGKGKVWSFTTLYDIPEGFNSPLHLAIVELEEGPKITAQITDLHFIETEKNINGKTQVVREYPQLRVDLPVEMVTRKITQDGNRGLIIYGYKFRPVMDTR